MAVPASVAPHAIGSVQGGRGDVRVASAKVVEQAVCPGGEDVISRSFVQTYGSYDSTAASIDDQIRGDNGGDMKPQVWAVANQGIHPQWGNKAGYYSVYAPAKNPIVLSSTGASGTVRTGSSGSNN